MGVRHRRDDDDSRDAFYLVAVRGESPTALGLLMAPAALLSAVAAAAAGRAAVRLGQRAVIVSGLGLLVAGLLVITRLGEQSSLWVLFAAVAFNAVGAAVVETIEATVMLQTAPVELSGAVAAVKSAVGQAAYSMGPAVFALVGTTLFVHSAGIGADEARGALRVAQGHNVLDPQRAREVVDGVHASMIDAIHALAWMLTAVPLVAIVAALILMRPARA